MKKREPEMTSRRRYSVGLGPFGPCGDRFCPRGYRESLDLMGRVELARRVEGLDGLELHTHMFESIDVEGWRQILLEDGWGCSIVSVNVWGEAKWGRGSLTSPDKGLRREAIEVIKRGMDQSKALGANKVNLWLGQDGHDYPFQTDYREMWSRLIDGIGECAAHDPEVRICLEYKLKEPRVHMAVGTVGKVLYLINKVGLPNVGCNLDVGHAIGCNENPAESAILLHNEKRLFHIHFNDNPGDWDWDMTTGSSHFWELLELCFWLDMIGWDDYYSFDIFPAREDPVGAVEANIQNVEGAFRLIEKLDRQEVLEILHQRDHLKMNALLREIVYGKGGRS
ncbi:MAG TPA: hypothetical protein EYP53_11015 [Candidatus Latescibacteria bacterium]|nr:hypothetical protein [Candidatus Latescibacterota bacterium]